MKGIYFLIRYGVMKLENPKDYDSLWSIYNTKTDALTSEQLTQFFQYNPMDFDCGINQTATNN